MAKQGKRTKIALVGYKLANGGLERIFSNVSELLHHSNCDVHLIVLEDKIEYPHHGTLINLGHYSKFKKYFKLKQYLKINQFDYIIDFRYRINPWMELLFIHYMYVGFKFIYTIHSSKLDAYLTPVNWISQQILNKAYKIVAVSNALNEKIKAKYHYEKAVVIPNSISVKAIEMECVDSKLSFKYCIAVGRLVKLKQFDKLIETYSKSNLPNREIHLVILGEGEEKEFLENQIEYLQMTGFIHLFGFKDTALCYIREAQFLVLSSKYEGFSMVILEALSSGIPVISFDCKTGPSELVQDEYNGLLVENQNFEALQEAFERMVDDSQLYYLCKENAKASVISFSNENSVEKWLSLLNHNII